MFARDNQVLRGAADAVSQQNHGRLNRLCRSGHAGRQGGRKGVAMFRSIAILIMLVLAAIPASAQQLASGERLHTVRPGETLGDIARQYLGSAASWSRIWEANRDQVQNPDRIRVGMELRIPGSVATSVVSGAAGAGATVLGVGVGNRAVTFGDDLEGAERRELLRAVPFVPAAFEEPGSQTRTVFHGVRTSEAAAPSVILQRRSEITAVSPGVFHAAGWLIGEGYAPGEAGRVISFATDAEVRSARRSVRPHDEVRIQLAPGSGLAAGDELLAFQIRHVLPGVGSVAVPTAVVVVSEVVESGVLATVVAEFGRMEIGDRITAPRTFPLSDGVHPVASDIRTEAMILGFQERKELYLPGDFGFIDAGEASGLRVGDEFVALEGQDPGWVGREVARFQVVGVRNDDATVRVMSVNSPAALRPGLNLVLDRKMP